jgi:uncharacterized protein YjbI with pentapeptide repeats
MANEEHLKILKQGVEVWNRWREENPGTLPDLREVVLALVKLNLRGADLRNANLFRADLNGVDLSGANLSGASLSWTKLVIADLTEANLTAVTLVGADLIEAKLSGAVLFKAILHWANLSNANLSEANLSEADLLEADLRGADLIRADLSEANLSGVDLRGADLTKAKLSGAALRRANLSGGVLRNVDLSRADLTRAILVETDFTNANLTGCSVYGISAWDINTEGTNQSNLIISRHGEPIITVDSLEVAQFIYLLLHNKKIRHIIDTITSKVVLILGRFTPERKAILDAIRDELRRRDYLPVLFDFEKPSSRDLSETLSTLAHMARFVIADMTDAKSIPQELEQIVPDLPSVPVQPLIASSDYEYALFEHIRRYPWVLEICQYDSLDDLLTILKGKVIDPAEMKAKEIIEGNQLIALTAADYPNIGLPK